MQELIEKERPVESKEDEAAKSLEDLRERILHLVAVDPVAEIPDSREFRYCFVCRGIARIGTKKVLHKKSCGAQDLEGAETEILLSVLVFKEFLEARILGVLVGRAEKNHFSQGYNAVWHVPDSEEKMGTLENALHTILALWLCGQGSPDSSESPQSPLS